MNKGDTLTISGSTYYCINQNSRSYIFSKDKDGKNPIRLTKEEIKYIKNHKKN